MLTFSSSTKMRVALACLTLSSLVQSVTPCNAAYESRPPAGGDPQRSLHVRQVKLYDTQGFGQPIVSRTFLLPADWQVAGGVRWNTEYVPNCPAYYESFSAISGDGQVSFEMLPSYSWVWYTDPQMRQLIQQSGGALAAPLSAAGVVQEYIIPNYRPGVAIVSVTPRPDLSQIARQQLMNAGLGQLEANGCRVYLDFVEVRMTSTVNGVRYDELAVVQLIRTDFSYGGIQSFMASNIFLFRAPASQWNENEPIYATAMRSMRQNPGWLKAINQFQRNMAKIQQDGIRRRQQIMREMYEDTSRMQQQSWEYQQESVDHVAREFSEYIRDVETYHDPATGYNVELPNTYDYAYSNGRGDYVVTNDPLYNPSADLFSSNWEVLELAP